jgi:hypothetical protein
MVFVLRQAFALKDVLINSHACSLVALLWV